MRLKHIAATRELRILQQQEFTIPPPDRDQLGRFPPETWLAILGELDYLDLMSVSVISKAFRVLANNFFLSSILNNPSSSSSPSLSSPKPKPRPNPNSPLGIAKLGAGSTTLSSSSFFLSFSFTKLAFPKNDESRLDLLLNGAVGGWSQDRLLLLVSKLPLFLGLHPSPLGRLELSSDLRLPCPSRLSSELFCRSCSVISTYFSSSPFPIPAPVINLSSPEVAEVLLNLCSLIASSNVKVLLLSNTGLGINSALATTTSLPATKNGPLSLDLKGTKGAAEMTDEEVDGVVGDGGTKDDVEEFE
ncbi:hypothetical protein P7C70_g1598, partial [Phenoliferia sp. Uapishka_3]